MNDKDPILAVSHEVTSELKNDVHKVEFQLVTPVISFNENHAKDHIKALNEDLDEIAKSKFYKPAKFDFGSLYSRDKNKRYYRTISFESSDLELLDEIYRDLQQRFKLKSELRFLGTQSFVSNQLKKKEQEKLLKQLMEELMEKAQKLAEYAGFDHAELVRVMVNQNRDFPRPVHMRAEIAMDTMSTLPIADRESTIRVSASADFRLDD